MLHMVELHAYSPGHAEGGLGHGETHWLRGSWYLDPRNPALSPVCCVMLGKRHNLSEPLVSWLHEDSHNAGPRVTHWLTL